jgi:hypothetical protein
MGLETQCSRTSTNQNSNAMRLTGCSLVNRAGGLPADCMWQPSWTPSLPPVWENVDRDCPEPGRTLWHLPQCCVAFLTQADTSGGGAALCHRRRSQVARSRAQVCSRRGSFDGQLTVITVDCRLDTGCLSDSFGLGHGAPLMQGELRTAQR